MDFKSRSLKKWENVPAGRPARRLALKYRSIWDRFFKTRFRPLFVSLATQREAVLGPHFWDRFFWDQVPDTFCYPSRTKDDRFGPPFLTPVKIRNLASNGHLGFFILALSSPEPKLSKNVITNVPNHVVGGCARRFFNVQQMSQTLGQGGVRKGFFKVKKCPKPRGRGLYARDAAIDLIRLKSETLKGFIRPHLNFAHRLYVRCFWS